MNSSAPFLDEQSIFPPEEAGTESFNCPDDYLVINGIRLCGGRFNDGTIITDHTMSAPVTGTAIRTVCNVSFHGIRKKSKALECQHCPLTMLDISEINFGTLRALIFLPKRWNYHYTW